MSLLRFVPHDSILPFFTPLFTWLHFRWLEQVDQYVPQPYLDEVFHIPQANAYWRGNWSHWDDKITTPPGLYFYSIFLNALFDFDYAGTVGADLSPYQLRWSNFLLVHLLILVCTVWKGYAFSDESRRSGTVVHLSAFPILFFFGGLYYTDIFAAMTVMCTYLCWEAGKDCTGFAKFGLQVLHVLSGLISLSSRQTNVFWCAVFLGGLQAVHTVKKHVNVHDPAIEDAYFEDIPTTIISLCTSALQTIPQLLLDLWPSVSLLGAFAAFVYWNGGVVLGDKTNHTAGIHLPQLLYLWPFLMFFSWPVILSQLANISELRSHAPRLWLAASVMLVMVAMVHYNTVIHPFLLADNRHYTFYIFKILRTCPWLWYAAVPVYALCMWLSIQALAGTSSVGKRISVSNSNTLKVSTGSPNTLHNAGIDSNQISFVLIWVASTALSLVTAPLVEPRYFLIPWLLWRIHVPDANKNLSHNSAPSTSVLRVLQQEVAKRALLIEVAWYLAINYVTCQIFVAKGFTWPSEPDGVQRFMW